MKNSPKVTPREQEVLHLIAHEHSTKEIASKLYVSYETVNSHRKNLLRKMDVRNTAGLVRVGFEYGLLRIATILMIGLFTYEQSTSQIIGLQVDPSHNVLFGETMDGPGTKLMWIPSKHAFRAGELIDNSTQLSESWNIDSIGDRSAAFGYNNIVKGESGMSWGEANRVEGIYGTAWGSSNTSRLSSTVWGLGNQATETQSTGWGWNNIASGARATVWGRDNVADGFASTAWGRGNEALSINETIFGMYADTCVTPNRFVAEADDQLFAIGNGTSTADRNNAMTVLKNGNIGINTSLPSQLLTINHDISPALMLQRLASDPVQMQIAIEGDNLVIRGGIDTTGMGLNTLIELDTKGKIFSSGIEISDTTMPVLRFDRSDPNRFDFEIAMDGADLIFQGGKDGVGSSLDTLVRISENGDISSVGNIMSEGDIVGDRLQVVDDADGSDWILTVDNMDDFQFRFENTLISYIDDADGSYNIHSDLRLKNSIEPVNRVLDKVKLLNPSTYYYNESKSNRRSIGFIAQEVEKVFPELVREKDGYKALAYDDFAILSIKAIQEQQEIIDGQQQELEDVKSQNDELIQRIKRLEQLILTRE